MSEKREGTPHDRIAKLKARHKSFYTPTRSTLAFRLRPIILPSLGLSLFLLFLILLPPSPGANRFSFFSLSTISPTSLSPFLARPGRRVGSQAACHSNQTLSRSRLNRYTTSPYSPPEQVAGGYQPVFFTLYRSCCSILLTRPRSSSQMLGKSRRPPTIGSSLIVLQSSILNVSLPLLPP